MGLTEKRKVKELTETTIPERTKELSEIIGADIVYDIDWSSFETFDELNFVDNVTCHRVNMAFRCICSDSTGKEAAQESVKTIKITNIKNKDEKSMAFSAVVLEFRCSYADKLDGAFSDNEIRKLVEDGL